MIRKAYRKYFKDVDDSYPNADRYFLIKVLEKGNHITDSLDNPINIKLNLNEGAKAYIYDFDKGWRLKYVINDGKSNKDSLEIKSKYVLMYEKFDWSQVTAEVAQEYALAIYPVYKGEKFNNGNSGNTVEQGMFNETGFQNTNVGKSTHIGNRNKISVFGTCKVFPGGFRICSSFHAIANNDNYISIKMNNYKDNTSIICENNNIIIGNEINEDCIFKDNNIIRNPDFSFGEIHLMPQYPKLAFQTVITEDGKEGDNFVTVKDTDFVLHNAKFMFATEDAGFVFRRISKVEGNRIYFDKPVSAKEAPIKHGICAGEVPYEEPEVNLQLKRKAKKYSRRLFTDVTTENLHLRKCIITKNGIVVLETVALYFDEPSHTLIINDTLPEDIDPGTDNIKITFPEFKFVGPYNFVLGEKMPNLYTGEQIFIDDKSYTVTGYDYSNNTLEFKEIDFNSIKGKSANVDKVDEKLFNTEIIPFKKLNLLKGKTYLDIIKVSFTEGLTPGAYVKYKNDIVMIKSVKPITLENGKKEAELTLARSFLPFAFSNKLVIGKFISDVSFDMKDIQEDLESFKKLNKGNQ